MMVIRLALAVEDAGTSALLAAVLSPVNRISRHLCLCFSPGALPRFKPAVSRKSLVTLLPGSPK